MATGNARRELAFVFLVAVAGIAVVLVVAFAPWYGAVALPSRTDLARSFPRSWSCGWNKSGVNAHKGNHNSKIAVDGAGGGRGGREIAVEATR